jgi:hypothetical protein
VIGLGGVGYWLWRMCFFCVFKGALLLVVVKGEEGVGKEGKGEEYLFVYAGVMVFRFVWCVKKLISRVYSIHFAADVATRGQVEVCHC